MKEHIEIFKGNSIVVNRLAFILEEEGIASLIKDNIESARLAGFGTTFDDVILYVFKSDFQKAESIIKNYLKENH